MKPVTTVTVLGQMNIYWHKLVFKGVILVFLCFKIQSKQILGSSAYHTEGTFKSSILIPTNPTTEGLGFGQSTTCLGEKNFPKTHWRTFFNGIEAESMTEDSHPTKGTSWTVLFYFPMYSFNNKINLEP